MERPPIYDNFKFLLALPMEDLAVPEQTYQWLTDDERDEHIALLMGRIPENEAYMS